MRSRTLRRRGVPDLLLLLRAAAVSAVFFFAGAGGRASEPYAVPLAAAYLAAGGHPLAAPVLVLLPVLARPTLFGAVGAASAGVVLAGVAAVCRAKERNFRLALPAVTLVALVPYLFLPGTGSLWYRAAAAALCAALSPVFYSAARGAGKAAGTRRSADEALGGCVLLFFAGLGVNRLLGAGVWRSAAVLGILFSAALAEKSVPLVLAVAFGLPTAAATGNFAVCGAFPVLAAVAVGFAPVSRPLAAAAVALADAVMGAFFGVYGGYGALSALFSALPAAAFLLVPGRFLAAAAEKLRAARDFQIPRAAINHSRAFLAGRLSELSGAFSEIGALLGERRGEADADTDRIAERMIREGCGNCPAAATCPRPPEEAADKLARVGVAKGKVSLADVPKELSDVCRQPNHLLFGLNRLLAACRDAEIARRSEDAGKELVAELSLAVAGIMREMALQTGKALRYDRRAEKKIARALAEKGMTASEVLAFGEGDEIEVGLICPPAVADKKLERAVSAAVGTKLSLFEKTDLSPEKCHLVFRRRPRYDAAFGVATEVKEGSEASGDTHSLVRLGADRFLLALSDGMGSGEAARSFSSSALSLIESFCRAGMDRSAVLSAVNRLFSLSRDDSFAALDAATVDLRTGKADLVKIGAPYGFVLTKNGIRLVEASSLPLGIVDGLAPAVCSVDLSAGDTVLFLSDGVTDAFPSSTDMLDFLSRLPVKNPQSLAESVVARAKELSGGKAADDMTALAVRLFEQAA